MKKKYIAPALHAVHVQPQNMMALSLLGTANESDALVKENDWDIFGESAVEESFSDSPFED